jgi:hypothetical protein
MGWGIPWRWVVQESPVKALSVVASAETIVTGTPRLISARMSSASRRKPPERTNGGRHADGTIAAAALRTLQAHGALTARRKAADAGQARGSCPKSWRLNR